MLAVRIGLLVLYLVGMASLSHYLREHFSISAGGPFVSGVPSPSPTKVILWIWGPTLWVVPGLLWLGVLDLPLGSMLLLSFLLPLCCLMFFLWRNRIVAGATFGLVILGTLIAIALALMAKELSYAAFGLFVVSSVAAPLFSIWLLTVWAPRVVPLPDALEHRTTQALALVLGFFTGRPKSMWVVEDGQIHTRIAGNPWSGVGPGLLATEPENVVVLRSGSAVARVAGPGVVLLQKSEVPYRVVDLRDQARSSRVSTITRDGIEVRTAVSTLFRVDRGNHKMQLGEAWPFRSRGDVLQALFAEEVDPTGRSLLDAQTAHPWEDLPTKIAAHKLEQALSFYSLNQLYSGVSDGRTAENAMSVDAQIGLLETHRQLEAALGLPQITNAGDSLARVTISQLVLRAVRKALEPRGFDIHDVEVSSPIEPENHGVTEQRVEAWKSRFMAKVMDWQAELDRQRAMALSKIRQEAREKLLSEMIEKVNECLTMTDSGAQRDFVAYTVLSDLIRMAADPEVQQQLPESALPALEQLYEQVGGLAESEEEKE